MKHKQYFTDHYGFDTGYDGDAMEKIENITSLIECQKICQSRKVWNTVHGWN